MSVRLPQHVDVTELSEDERIRRKQRWHSLEAYRFRLRNIGKLVLTARDYALNWDAAQIDEPSYFVIGIAKGGSTLMHAVVRDICERAGRAYIDAPAAFFAHGVEPGSVLLDLDWLRNRDGTVFGGFRWVHPWIDDEVLHKRDKIVLVRDPRDCLVSLYFSHAYSHAKPGEGLTAQFSGQRRKALEADLDSFVLSEVSGRVFQNFCRILALTRLPNLTLFRYEDVVFDKRRWVGELTTALGADLDEASCQTIADAHDRIPDSETENAHIRQVTPGDNARKLKPETIKRLNETFAPILDAFGYER